ncbi:hypothetical protein LV779_30285 [Streptomyces thinghirensis]|nr:hypothetical protein [Streptomyces thinghirensis]
MSPQHLAAWPPAGPAAVPGPADHRDPLAWIAPTVATVLLERPGTGGGTPRPDVGHGDRRLRHRSARRR